MIASITWVLDLDSKQVGYLCHFTRHNTTIVMSCCIEFESNDKWSLKNDFEALSRTYNNLDFLYFIGCCMKLFNTHFIQIPNKNIRKKNLLVMLMMFLNNKLFFKASNYITLG